MKAVVVAHGSTTDEDARELAGADLVVAADAGALAVERWGRVPDAIVGDLDSLGEDLAASFARRGAQVRRSPVDKDETDLELAVAYARERGAGEIVVLGAFGGRRLDYDVANALLLVGWGAGVRAVRGGTTLRALRAGEDLAIEGGPGDRVTLVAAAERTVVETEGLRWPLRDEALALGTGRGVSNELSASRARVRCGSGALVVIEEHEATGEPRAT